MPIVNTCQALLCVSGITDACWGVWTTPKEPQGFEALKGAPKIFSRDKSCRAI